MSLAPPPAPTKSEYAPLVKLLVTVVILVIVFYVVFVLPVGCTVSFPFGIRANGHTTIWQMLTGNACSYP